ncbi:MULTISPECIES: hypothetical protein [unclassified Pseudomonas]|uniref:hypothetical protein n=1 Tax=unclassified Pseudomonas TaxID=196821 RepID=UPI0024491240|nr:MULTISPECIES: hypothetical protein [unclassified Pseudomonas]MDG9927403.1 hypothetical protein [Pseudomonas sp. GD04042]MDH0482472.1 hypothetical protein [Pseudomonas sp. GD04015]MDH0602824.1 hypothetical protein [Pseudomonas sp. GD03869]
MYGFKKGSKPKQQLANGGRVRGPGTGTSDDIPAQIPAGSYIMPADSTEQIGEGALAAMGQGPVDVNLSNGEFGLPPEQVHAVGVQALDAMKNATHTPTGQPALGFKPGGGQQQAGEPELFFADGGVVNDDLKKRLQQLRGASPTVQQPGAGPKPNVIYGNSDGVSGRGFMPSSARGVTVSGQPVQAAQRPGLPPPAGPAPAAPEPNYRARAEAMGRAKADSAAYEAERARQDARFSEAQARGGQPAQPVQSTTRGFASGARNFVNKAGKGGAVLSAVPGIINAMDDDSTATYAKRLGLDEPTGDGSAGDIAKFAALRGLGFATDVGSAMTFGLADKLYQDKRAVDTDTLAASAGALGGGTLGFKGGNTFGSVADTAMRLASRGRYKGNYGERYGGKVGGVVGAGTGATAGLALADDDTQEASRANGAPQASAVGPLAATSPVAPSTPVGEGLGWSNTGSGVAVRMGADGTPEFSNAPEALSGAADMPAGGFQPRSGRPPEPTGPGLGFGSYTPDREFAQLGSMSNLGNSTGTFSQLEPGTSALALERFERANQERARMIEESRRGQLGEGGGRLTIVRDSTRAPSRAELLNDRLARADAAQNLEEQRLGFQSQEARARLALDQQRLASEIEGRGFQTRAAQRQEALYEKYETAKTPEERATIAQQIRDLAGREASSPWKVQVTPTTRNADGSTSEGSVIRYNNQTGQVEMIDQQVRRKSVSLAEVEQAAEEDGVSVEDYIKSLQDMGVTVG